MRWSEPESRHITLQFLGEVHEEQQYQCLVRRLREIRFPPVPIRLGGAGVFERAGVFIVEAEVTPQLMALERLVVAATEPCGFQVEFRPYRPHITLARGRGPDRGRALLDRVPPRLEFARFVAEEFLLYESHLSPAGSTHEVRQRFRLET
jgi:2'-5' RNA ligase